MPNTTNFNWPTPADTDLVKDGAAAIRNLGDGVDTSLVDLKGGTTGQILSKASNADMDFAFITPNVGDLTEVQAGTGLSVADGTGPIPIVTNTVATEFDAKGDLVVGTGSDTFDRLAVGTDGYTLVADSSVSPTGLKWAVDPVADVITTAGDLIYGTAADTVARLGIGTAGQVLKVNSGANAPEWGAAGGAAGITLITNAALSSGTNNINNCFSATYKTYLIVLTITNMSSGANIRFRLRASGTDATTNYKLQTIQFASTTTSTSISAITDFWQFGNADPTKAFFMVDLMNPFESDTTFAFAKSVTGSAGAYTDPLVEYPSAYNTNATSYDGITIYSHNGATITGNARIYGRADS